MSALASCQPRSNTTSHADASGRGRGSGLGQSIARTLVEAHGGTLTLASVLGWGTVATIRLPSNGTS
ncbi:ATP-binding protein [Deinococcus pimensis]|uniref:ATP-binding protein n=1 Tax=Deinococcus pimensis TaxID=309888 RepID=UPI000A043751|nr:ATP-binding protein [Deinococcus pimensis]